jgi:hypothetical protein
MGLGPFNPDCDPNCCGTSGGGGGDIPGCTCQGMPNTLTMTISGTDPITGLPACDPGTFQPCTLLWQTTPTAFSGLGLGSSCYLSTTTFTDPYTGTDFYYVLGCTAVFYSLSRIYVGPPPYHDSTIYAWSVGLTGNTCTPFLLSNGFGYSGINPACLVVISG